MSRRLAVVLGLATVFVVGAAASSKATLAKSPRVRPATGWVVVRPSRAAQPYLSASMIVAVTAPDVAAVRPFAQLTSFRRLSVRGIVIWATTLGRNRPKFTRMQWPPQLSTFRVDHGWEGQPANVQQRLKAGLVDGWDMDVPVAGVMVPSSALDPAAASQLRRELRVLPERAAGLASRTARSCRILARSRGS